MTKEKKDSALVFVGQIMTAYKAAMRVEGEALKAAIECGKYLNLAKENVKADKGKWLPWLKQNCPEISQQTASLYVRLADPENLDKLVGVKTIRDADKALRQSSQDEGSDDDDETNNALLVEDECEEVTALRASEDLVSLLKNVGPDEVATAIKQADWGVEDLRKLISLLTIRTAQAPAAGTSVTSPPPVRPVEPNPLRRL
jgi:hypothetical protein